MEIFLILLVVFVFLIYFSKTPTPSVNKNQGQSDKIYLKYDKPIDLTVCTEKEVEQRYDEIKLELDSIDRKVYRVKSEVQEIKGLYFRSKKEQLRATYLYKNEELFFEKEPDNEYDPFAIKVKTFDGSHIGYVARENNRHIWHLIDNEAYYKALLFDKDEENDIPYQTYKLLYAEEIPKKELEKKRIRNNLNRNKRLLRKAIKENNTDNIVKYTKYVAKYEDELKAIK